MAKFQSKNVQKKKGIGSELRQALMTGISYMLPLVIAGAVIMGIARIGASFFDITNIWDAVYANSDNGIVRMLHSFDHIGGIGLRLMLPIISGYIAYGIARKPALAPGLIAGALAQEIGTGFLGALAAGLLAGYIVRFIIARVKLPNALASAVPIFIVPLFGTLVTCLIVLYIIGEPLIALNQGLESWLKSMSGTNKVALAAIIGAMVGFDLGGPVNKAAVTSALALITSGIYDPNTAVQVAIIVPPLGLGMAAIAFRNRFSSDLQEVGKASLLMGMIGISEGAIPFILAHPKIILLNMFGSAVAGAMAVGLGAVNRVPISGFYGWLAVEGWPMYVLSIATGAGIIALGSLLILKPNPQYLAESSGSVG